MRILPEERRDFVMKLPYTLEELLQLKMKRRHIISTIVGVRRDIICRLQPILADELKDDPTLKDVTNDDLSKKSEFLLLIELNALTLAIREFSSISNPTLEDRCSLYAVLPRRSMH
jgi:hypothetical protein